MPYKEKKIEKLYYSIGEVARMFDVNTSLIRFWEREFDIIKPKKNKKGNRFFTKQDITEVREHTDEIRQIIESRGFRTLAISAVTRAGLPELVTTVAGELDRMRQEAKELSS